MSEQCFSMEKVIEVTNISKTFSGRKVLDNVSISVQRGSICGLVGRNGCGKTVLMKCICGFIVPEIGQIKLFGKKVSRKKMPTDNMGIIIENPGFMEDETAMKNLQYLAKLNNHIEKKQVEKTIIRVGLDPKEKKKVKNYSLGMRQRLAIAQAIMEEQDVIILDEPMNGLDIEGVKKVRQLLLELKNEGKTILLASHNSEDIRHLCDKVYRMDAGKIIDKYSSDGFDI